MKHFLFKNTTSGRGRRRFSLIEMMVSLAIFSIVALVATGALLKIIDANKKAQALKSVMNNLNFAVESMSREMRVGSTYHCDNDGALANLDVAADCPSGVKGKLLAFKTWNNKQYIYKFTTINGTIHLQKSEDGGAFYDVVSTNVILTADSQFIVTGYPVGGGSSEGQPKVTIFIKGYV